MSTVPDLGTFLQAPRLHHDILDRTLPVDTAPLCAYCGGPVWIGPLVIAYPQGARPGWILHGMCHGMLKRYYREALRAILAGLPEATVREWYD